MKKCYWLIILFCLQLAISYSTVAINLGANVIIQSGNEYYTVPSTLPFNQIITSTISIRYNNTIFYITSPNNIDISLTYLDNDIANANDGETVLSFNADTTSGVVLFTITGFVANQQYEVKRDVATISNPTANDIGQISFTSGIWSEHEFRIVQENASASATPPLVDTSGFFDNPLDYLLTPFRSHIGIYVWPAIFISVIGFVYVSTHNLGSTLASILLIFGLFGSVSDFIQVPEFILFSSILAIAGLAGIILSLFMKKHGG